jgi:predicted small lipoprotein YifL
MVKRKKLVSTFISGTLLVLVGCGQKGPLYLAEEDAAQTNQQQQQTPVEKTPTEQQ